MHVVGSDEEVRAENEHDTDVVNTSASSSSAAAVHDAPPQLSEVNTSASSSSAAAVYDVPPQLSESDQEEQADTPKGRVVYEQREGAWVGGRQDAVTSRLGRVSKPPPRYPDDI